MAAVEVVEAIPLAKDKSGVYRIGKTRVTLDLVVHAFNRGATPEEIVQDYPALELPDVYQVIGYYLKHSKEIGEYLARREHEEDGLLATNLEDWLPLGLRDRLLARRKSP